MKRIFPLLTLLFACFQGWAQSCLPEGITFTTQAQINSFSNQYPGCHTIGGDVIINETDITSLGGLSVLTGIGGDLVIVKNPGLDNLHGLENLVEVGGTVSIVENNGLNNLTGLPGLVHIGGNLNIQAGDMTSLAGLNSLQRISGNLTLESNQLLSDLVGLAQLKAIGGELAVSGNPKLTGFTNLSNLDSVGGISVNYCAKILNFQGLQGLTTIGGDVRITTGNSGLKNCNGLDNVTSIQGDLSVKGPAFESFSGLSQLNAIQGVLKVSETPLLKNFAGLWALASIGEGIYISEVAGLENFSGLSSLTTLPGYLNLSFAPKLKDFQGLDHLVTLGGALSTLAVSNRNYEGLNNLTSIGGNFTAGGDSLLNFSGLSSLVTVHGFLSISGPLLNSLHGLDNLDSIGSLSISATGSLQDLSGLNGLQAIASAIYMGDNHALQSLSGLDNLQTVGGNFFLQSHPALTSLSSLHRLRAVGGGLNLYGAPLMTTLDGLDSLRTIGGGLYINGNTTLTGLSDLSRLDSLGGILEITSNDSLMRLTGLEGLRHIGSDLSISYNSSLQDIAALSNVQSVGGSVWIFNNPALSGCAIYPVCNQIFNHPDFLNISDNAPGCNTPYEVELLCGALPVLATVRIDGNANCQTDPADAPAEGVLVRLDGNIQHSIRPTDATGTAPFGLLSDGVFSLSLPQFPTSNWQVCPDTLWFLPDTLLDTIRADFYLQPLNQCPDLAVDLWLPPFFRGCLATTPVQVVVRNVGTVTAADAQLAVVLPEELHWVSSVPAPDSQHGDTLFFQAGDLPPFGAYPVNLVVGTDCDDFLLGRTLCMEAFSSLSNPCPPGTPASEIRLFSECLNDTTVRFLLKNVGPAATQNAHDYVIIEDEVILMQAPFTLGPLGSLAVDVPAGGATYRMEATKYDDGTLTALARENCGGLTPGFITAYWLDDGRQNYDFDCRQVVLAYDPNQKTAIPTGVGPAHLLAANKPLQYTIEFQNTGTDTAFRVLVRDVLPPQLDLTSFRPGASTNPYTWQIAGDTLEVLFLPIALPDSNVNEAASHGWFSFDLDQKPDLPDGTVIQNTASIIFDYNPPIVTNTVWHTIGKLTVSVDEPADGASTWQVAGNPARETATFRSVEMIPGLKRFELADAVGRVVRTAHFDGQTFEFRRGRLPGGVYAFRIYDARGRATAGKIILSD